jgi:hypothetical protein
LIKFPSIVSNTAVNEKMKLVVTPTYKDIFGEKPPLLTDLFQGIPTEVVIKIVALMNAELYLDNGSSQAQARILDIFLSRQKKDILQNVFKCTIGYSTKEVAFFSKHINLEFLHFALANYYENDAFIDTDPTQELNLFKAYLLVSEQISSRTQITENASSPLDYFRKNTWPTFISQLEVNNSQNYFPPMIKAKAFFDAFEFDPKYTTYVSKFLEKYDSPNSWTYIHRLANAIQKGSKKQEGSKFAPFYIRIDKTYKPLFEDLTIDPEVYKHQYGSGKNNFNGLKDKPLYKLEELSYLVIDWDILSKKIYNGLVFDFYKKSGISSEKQFQKFIDFKNYISKEAVENILFKKLIKGTFKKKHIQVCFDEGNSDGFPDAYVRVGKKIFLFEIKDAYFPSESIESFNYDEIRESIDKKYNTTKKGTSQLINSIKRLKESALESRSYKELNLKKRNLVVYPILVYTDIFFSMPGVMLYLQEEFKKKVEKEGLQNDFQQIKDLVFIDIEYMIDNLDLLQKKEFSLDKVIDFVLKGLKKREAQFKTDGISENLSVWNQNFENIAASFLSVPGNQRKLVKTLFEELDLMKGLK